MHLFQHGDFTLSSGRTSKFKIDCDALSSHSIETLALMMWEVLMFRPSAVVPVPEGGVRLAEALSRIVQKNGGFLDTAPLIIVDDVLTTGASMEEVRGENTNVVGIVVFARGPCPQWVIPLFHMRGL